MMRTVLRLHPALRDDIGDLVTRRPVPGPGIDHVGAFLFLNHHGPQTYPPNNRGLPFGPHPHRGFETVTFILEGELAHTDSAGHSSIIRAGGIQWMTAGGGIVHAEVSPPDFLREGGLMEILQLWLNLPARLKMTAPRYIGLQAGSIPVVDGVHLIAGMHRGVTGPVESLTGTFLSWVTLAPGEAVEIRASEAALLLFGHAEPIDEPIVAHGPFVMNTADEIRQAFADYQAGKFGVAEIVEA